ncbi:zinc finger domain-containing protein [Streptomyces sp. NRRL F-2580]
MTGGAREPRCSRTAACPACGAAPGVRCEIAGGYHPSRVVRLRRSLHSR